MNIIKSYIFIEKMCYDTPSKVQEVMVQNWTHKQSIIVLHSKKKKKSMIELQNWKDEMKENSCQKNNIRNRDKIHISSIPKRKENTS